MESTRKLEAEELASFLPLLHAKQTRLLELEQDAVKKGLRVDDEDEEDVAS